MPNEYAKLGERISIDGSLIDAVFSMYCTDYRNGSKKAKAHFGFDINRSIPSKIFLTDGKGNEHPFASQILSPGQTGIMDRGYQCHKDFDTYQREGKHFVCRIKKPIKKTVMQANSIETDTFVFYDANVLLGLPNVSQIAGLITYLLIAIFCHNNFNEKVSIKRVRKLRIKIINELRDSNIEPSVDNNVKEQRKNHNYANS